MRTRFVLTPRWFFAAPIVWLVGRGTLAAVCRYFGDWLRYQAGEVRPLCQRRVRQLPLEISVLMGGESDHDSAQASACS